jgi:hypothetical protein
VRTTPHNVLQLSHCVAWLSCLCVTSASFLCWRRSSCWQVRHGPCNCDSVQCFAVEPLCRFVVLPVVGGGSSWWRHSSCWQVSQAAAVGCYLVTCHVTCCYATCDLSIYSVQCLASAPLCLFVVLLMRASILLFVVEALQAAGRCDTSAADMLHVQLSCCGYEYL